jgi:hypothetical protein
MGSLLVFLKRQGRPKEESTKLALQYSAQARIISGPPKVLQELTSSLSAFTSGTCVHGKAKLFYAGEKQGSEQFSDTLSARKECKLLSAPRVTFLDANTSPGYTAASSTVRPLFKVVMRNNPVEKSSNNEKVKVFPIEDFKRWTYEYDPLLAQFCDAYLTGGALIADCSTQVERQPDGTSRNALYGIVVGLNARSTATPDNVDVNLYFNCREKHTLPRGAVFWKTPPTAIYQCPNQLQFTMKAGDSLAFLSEGNEPETALLVLFSIEQVVPQETKIIDNK